MTLSGIAVTDDAVQEYLNNFQKAGSSLAFIIYDIVNVPEKPKAHMIDIFQKVARAEVADLLAEAEAEGFKKLSEEPEDYALLRHILTKGEQPPRYATIIVTRPDKSTKIVLLTWCSNNAPVKKRMLISSSKDELRKKLNGVHYLIQASDEDDLSYAEVLKAVKSL